MTVKQNKGDTENINNYLKLAPLLQGGVPDAVGRVGIYTCIQRIAYVENNGFNPFRHAAAPACQDLRSQASHSRVHLSEGRIFPVADVARGRCSKPPITFLVFLVLSLLLSSCTITKHLPAGESLYIGATVKVIPDSTISNKERKNIETQLLEFVKPKPNSKFLGMKYKLWFYNLFGEPKREKGFKYFIRKRFGEPPVLASKSVTLANAKQLGFLLENEGYFGSSATGDLVEKKRKSMANYIATVLPRYYLDSINYFKDSSTIGRIFKNARKRSILKTSDPYRFEAILAERSRLANQLKQRGFYYFQPEYIIVKADTSFAKKVNISVEIKPSTVQAALKPYRINEVHVLADYGEIIVPDSLKFQGHEVTYKGVKIYDKTGTFSPKVFSQAIAFRAGSRYSTTAQDISLSRLINLNGNFKFVKNTFNLVPRSDSALLNAYYFLTPIKAKSVVAEVNGVTKSNNFTGINLSISWLNRNTFSGAELLKITATTGIDYQITGISKTLGAINTYRYALETSLSIPRFVIPFITVNPVKNQALPKTNMAVGYDLFKRGGYYDLTSLRTSLGYAWKQNSKLEHTYTPISVNLVKINNVSEAFNEEIFRSNNPIELLKLLDNKLIMSSNYTIAFTPNQRKKRHLFTFSGGLETAGNLASLLSKLGPKYDSAKTILGVAYAQYARLDADFRYYYTLNNGVKIANRFLVGYGLPYGNSSTLPTIKQYYSGGSSSIRAFAARGIGPGSYLSEGGIGSQFLGSQMGDIKLEMSTELRAKFNKYINGAFFIDAGNVWMNKDAQSYGKEAVFSNKFYKQIAVGTGIGLRLDFSYLILRFDLATPVRKPYLEEGHRWVLKDFDMTSKAWRSENLVLNVAVGYPF
jgi:outer membrane protein assembly factor BamA